MEQTLGSFLQQLRAARRLPQVQAARAVGVGRSTLAQWESGARRPHESDLDALLRALQASPEQQQQASELLRTSRLRLTRSQRQSPDLIQLSAQSSIGPIPNSGDLLRALRMRRGLSQSEAAERVGVTERTLRRWEKMEVWPSTPQLHTLCYALEAAVEEMVALSTASPFPSSSVELPRVGAPDERRPGAEVPGEVIPQEERPGVEIPRVEKPGMRIPGVKIPGIEIADWEVPKHVETTPSEIIEGVHSTYIHNYWWRRMELKELNFFLLAGLAWPHARHSEAGRRALSHVYSFHAAYLSTNERWSEAGLYANRALDVWPSSQTPNEVVVLAALTAARVAVYGGARPAPHKGTEILRHWLDVTPWPDYRGWLLSDLAMYTAMGGDAQTGASLAQQAQDVTEFWWNQADRAHRAIAHAQVLIWGSQYTQAQHITGSTFNRLPTRSLLLQAEAWLNQGDYVKAQERLETAWAMIESITWPHVELSSLSYLQTQARRLELRLMHLP